MAEITGYSSLLAELKNDNKKAALLVSLRDWFYRILEFDPKNGEALSDDLTHFLDKNYEFFHERNAETDDKNVFDYIYNILSFSGRALFHVFESPRKEILRFHEQMKVYQAREIDSSGIIEISRRPGRTVREKIASKPSVIAVKRRQSIDTLENRLLKKLIVKLTYILEDRNDVYSELARENDDSELSILYSKLCRWLKTDEADEIGEWQKLPPNNILLCDKFYKKIWRTWRFILDLDDFVQEDFEKLNRILATFVFWNMVSELQHRGSKIRQAPLNFDSKKFFVETVGYSNPEVQEDEFLRSEVQTENLAMILEENLIKVRPFVGKEHEIKVEFGSFEIDGKKFSGNLESLSDAVFFSNKMAAWISSVYNSEPGKERTIIKNLPKVQKFAVIDFSKAPYKSSVCSENGVLSENCYPKSLLRQFWSNPEFSDGHNVDCAVSPALYSGGLNGWSITQVSFDQVLCKELNKEEISSEIESEAVYNFMNSMRDYYNTGAFYYLIPDYIEDFSLGKIRSSANSVFSSANPVPKSVGAVFDFQLNENFAKFNLKSGDFVFVIEKKTVENAKEIFSVTPVCAKTEFQKSEKEIFNLKDFSEIPCGIRWEHHPPFIVSDYEPGKLVNYILKAARGTEGFNKNCAVYIISPEESVKNARLEMPYPNWHFVSEPFNAVRGLAESVLIQEKVPEIPLWSEHLPVLQMTVIKNGKRDGINLTNGKVVLPIRGKSQKIDISKPFTLGKNVKEYHFRLTRGEGAASSSLKYEAVLQNPAFPLKENVSCELEMYYSYGSEQPFDLYFRPKSSSSFIRAKVQWKPIDETAFPTPNFPEMRKWEEFSVWKDSKHPEGNNLIEWEETNFETLLKLRDVYLGKEISKKWEWLYDFQKAKWRARQKLGRLRIRFRFPTMQIWNIRNSVLKDAAVPDSFKKKIAGAKESLSFLLNNEEIKNQERLWNELFLFACVLHSDGIDLTSGFMKELLGKEIELPQSWQNREQKSFQFGYFIGDAKTPAQKEVLDWALDFSGDSELSFFKLQVLSIALWRNENLLKEIGEAEFKSLFERTVSAIDFGFLQMQEIYKTEGKILSRVRQPFRSYLELLCALIRCREFGKNFQDLLSPFNSEIQDIIEKIEKIYEWLKSVGEDIHTRHIRFVSADSNAGASENSEEGFLDYLLLWLDGEKSSEMPKIETSVEEKDDEEKEGDED